MNALFFLLTSLFIFLLWRRSRNLTQKIADLEEKLKILEASTILTDAHRSISEIKIMPEQVSAIPDYQCQPEITQALSRKIAVSPPMEMAPVLKPTAKELKKELPAIWVKLEKQLVENWTGILGAAIMVMGIGFLAIYAAVFLSAVFRFAMLCAVSVFLFALYFLLRKKEKWDKFARWMRSSCGAVLMFAFLGAGGIPGLKFIDDPQVSFALLLFGIILNLYFGYAGGTQYFASLHVLISLAGLAVAPQSAVTLIISSFVVFASIAITFKSRWEYHLLLSISSFFVYHLYWYKISAFDAHNLPPDMRIAGIASTLIVGIMAIFSHYREIYKTDKFVAIPFVVHILNWAFLGAGLMFYSTGSKWNSIILGASSVIVFFLARRARVIGIRWLYVTDVLISQSLAILTIITLSRWDIDNLLIAMIAYLEINIYLIVIDGKEEWLLQKAGIVMHHLSSIILIGYSISIFDYDNQPLLIENALVILFVLFIETVFHLYNIKKSGESFDSVSRYFPLKLSCKVSISGVLVPVMVVVLCAYLYRYLWASYFITALCIFLLIIRQKVQSNGIGMGLILLVPAVFIMSWKYMLLASDLSNIEILIYSAPLFVLALAIVKRSYIKILDRYVKWAGVYLFSINLVLLIYILFEPVSKFILGILCLIFSILYLEAAQYLRRKYKSELDYKASIDQFILHVAYVFIAIFLVRHFTVDLQTEAYLGNFTIRFLIESFALVVFIYWMLAKQSTEGKELLSWKYLHPLMSEFTIIFAMIILILETPPHIHPLLWICGSIVLLLSGRIWEGMLSRFRFYSLLFHWITVFSLAFILASYIVPSTDLFDQIWFWGAFAILMQFVFITLFYKLGDLDKIHLPHPVKCLAHLINSIDKNKNLAIYYPFFIGIAIFIYKSFDEAVHTLLWVVEAFLIFVVSVILKENHFRYLSMGLLAICLMRLMIYDLSKSGTIVKGIVFVCIGVLMLVMNTIYNKFKDRF
jgi:hypothetical protein